MSIKSGSSLWTLALLAGAASVMVVNGGVAAAGQVRIGWGADPVDGPRAAGSGVQLVEHPGGKPSRFVLTTADGVRLTKPDGKGAPTDAAFKLGLVPLIGLGPAMRGNLSGILAHSKLASPGATIALTIDSRLQAAAQAAIARQMVKMRATAGADKRKAAVVILDADTGAIVAVAGHPTVPAGAKPSDYAGRGPEFVLRDPFKIFAWGIVDFNNTPGAAFKPLVALSVIRKSQGAEVQRFHQALQGLKAGEMPSKMGLQAGQSAYFPNGAGSKNVIRNFGGQRLGPFSGMPKRNAACARKSGADTRTGQRPGTFGARQGIQRSVNVYFARLSQMLDQRRLRRIVAALVKNKAKNNAPRPLGETGVTRLIESLRSLGISDKIRMDLATNLPPNVALRRFKTRTAADVLHPQLSSQAILGVPIQARPAAIATLRHLSALNGIGQAVAVHPLHLARGAMAIASGKMAAPYIFHAWGGDVLLPPPAKPLFDRSDPSLSLRLAMLRAVRQGMKLVPETSTARAAFAASGDVKCRTHGKTGAAEIVTRTGQHTAWFMGWREPKGGPLTMAERRRRRVSNIDIHPRRRRLAYACMTTHGFGGFRTGGSSCAPIVANFLMAMEK